MFSLSELEDMEYRKVIVRGRFDHSKELYVMPRMLLSDQDSSPSRGRFDRPQPKSGSNVITAFEVSSTQHPKYAVLLLSSCLVLYSLIIDNMDNILYHNF